MAQSFEIATQKNLSRFRRRGRAVFRFKMASCWRRARFSMAKLALRASKALNKVHNK